MNRMSGKGVKSGMQSGCAVRVNCLAIVTTCGHSFDDCGRSVVPRDRHQAVFTRENPCFVTFLCRSKPARNPNPNDTFNGRTVRLRVEYEGWKKTKNAHDTRSPKGLHATPLDPRSENGGATQKSGRLHCLRRVSKR